MGDVFGNASGLARAVHMRLLSGGGGVESVSFLLKVSHHETTREESKFEFLVLLEMLVLALPLFEFIGWLVCWFSKG